MVTTAGFLSLISAAVTPVVMISACAVLIMGIATKHAGLSDRARALAAEYRATSEESGRRPVLRRELREFMRRAVLSWLAHCLIYSAAITFSATVLVALLALRRPVWGAPTVGLFILGTVLLVAALILEFTELLLAQATLRWETSDILSQEGRHETQR
jgi:uncharacterized protein DUF2721